MLVYLQFTVLFSQHRAVEYEISIAFRIPRVSAIDCVSDDSLSIEWIQPALLFKSLLSIKYRSRLRSLEYWLLIASPTTRWVSNGSDQRFRSRACWVWNINRVSIYWVSNIDRVTNDRWFLECQSSLQWFLEYWISIVSPTIRRLSDIDRISDDDSLSIKWSPWVSDNDRVSDDFVSTDHVSKVGASIVVVC